MNLHDWRKLFAAITGAYVLLNLVPLSPIEYTKRRANGKLLVFRGEWEEKDENGN